VKSFIFIFIITCYSFNFCHSQEIEIQDTKKNQSLYALIKSFEDIHKLNFSFDVDAIKKINIDIDTGNLSISQLLRLVKTQTAYHIIQDGEKDFLIIKKANEYKDICGYVIDSFSEFALSKADIIVNGEVKAISDKNGFFETRTPANDSIFVSYLGYKTAIKKTSDFKTNNCDTIALLPKVYELNSVVISDYLTTGIHKNVDGSATISTKKLKILPGLIEPDVLNSMQLLPGISSPTEDGAALYIRGGTPSQNLILFDGIKMYQTGHFFDQISAFNPYIIGETNVYRGGTSVRYGDRISGVVDIKTDNDLLDSFTIGGGFNLTHADVFIKSPISKKVGFLAAMRRSTSDIYDNITTNNLTEKVFQNTRGSDSSNLNRDNSDATDESTFNDINFKVLWEINRKNTLKFSSIFAGNKLNNFRESISDSIANTFSSIRDVFKIRNFGTAIQWKKIGDSKTVQNANIYTSYFDKQYNLTNINELSNDGSSKNNTVLDFGAEYSIDIPISTNKTWNLGYQFVRNKTTLREKERSGLFPSPNFFEFEVNFNGEEIAHTFFSEYRYTTPKICVNIGLRNSFLSESNQSYTEPRIFSSAEIFKNFRVTASLELKNQQLNQYAGNYPSISPIGPSLAISEEDWVLSNGTISFDFRDSFGDDPIDDNNFDDSVTIPVVKSRQFTLGTLYSYSGWHFDLEGYYKKISDISLLYDVPFFIAQDLNNNGDPDQPIYPTGQEDRVGLDFLVKKTFRNYRFWLGYTFSKTSIDFPNIQERSFPNKFDQRHVLNISQTLI